MPAAELGDADGVALGDAEATGEGVEPASPWIKRAPDMLAAPWIAQWYGILEPVAIPKKVLE